MYDGFRFHFHRYGRYRVEDGVAAMLVIVNGTGRVSVRCEWVAGSCRKSVLKYVDPTYMVDGVQR